MKVPKIGVIGSITLILIVLKITNYIEWSWWWVFSPLWGGVLLAFLLLFIVNLMEKYE
jgi:hypothetical protein